MPDAPLELDDLVDLKILPAWVNEPAPGERFAQHDGEDRQERRGRDRRPPRDKRGPDRRGPRREFDRAPSHAKPGERAHDRQGERRPGPKGPRGPRGDDRHRKDRHQHRPRPPLPEKPLPPIAVKFFPRISAFENVVAQIKSGPVAYSRFALARLFLEKATRHDLKLTAPADTSLFQLGENGAISTDRQFLERSAFRFTQDDLYKVEITETDPIKGNLTNVARDRFSGTLLGPTNHHDYQRRLRNLYEQRYSRRMNFPEFQRQIEIVSDPAVVEKWKEDARKVTTFSTREEPPQTFSSITEAEKHFEKTYLPALLRTVSEVAIEGPASREMQDRVLSRLIEQEWNREMRSPSPMMQELANRFRETGLHVFRHRKGMLFVSSIYPRLLTQEQTAVSSQVRTIVEAIAAQPRIGRKELADKLIVGLNGEETERAKMALASDLLWLISAGHVIEFNDGSLDLPRAKIKPKEKEEEAVEATAPAADQKEKVTSEQPPAEKENEKAAAQAADKEARVEAGAPPVEEPAPVKKEPEATVEAGVSPAEETEIGGS
ncbi:MAG: hypothetical protein DME57_04315 [Verrucomicrobia bacterium]|nr:MAG: hypothetical protein DME57_04315 [Verrucomicrobiota bacterium]